MATVRIYKVAELLNTTSQEVMALLKRDHGIEVKSASSTIEEVVAREFVTRLARQRGLHVPSNASFADTPAPVRGKKPGQGRAPEPAKPAAPALPPPWGRSGTHQRQGGIGGRAPRGPPPRRRRCRRLLLRRLPRRLRDRRRL